jgi:hypothetical protein
MRGRDQRILARAAGVLLTVVAQTAAWGAVGTSFTYQGLLNHNAGRANGDYDFQFKLYDLATTGTQIGTTATLENVAVLNGLFTVKINFGTGAFGGGARWLEVHVRPGSETGAYTALSPRQELTPAPYALALPNVYTNEGTNFVGVGRDFRISGNEVFGVRYVGGANQYGGMYVETAHPQGWPFYGYATNGSFRAWTYYSSSPPGGVTDPLETSGSWVLYSSGIRLSVPPTGGLHIWPSLNYSLLIKNTTGADGIRILDTGDDGIQIGSAPDEPNYGVYIPSPGVSTYGLWPNTSNALGEWALYTVDKISAGNVAAASLSIIAQTAGAEALEAGDVAAAIGVADALPGGHSQLPTVLRADGQRYTGVIGVVESRMVWEVAPGKEAEGEMSMHSAPGTAAPGDYVSLVVLGVTQVKVAPNTPIAAGSRLTVSNLPGHSRPLRTAIIGDMPVTEGMQAIGVALEAPTGGKNTIPVFVNLR